MKIEAIAKICHEANKAYCESLGDTSQKSWEEADDWQRQSSIDGVRFRLSHPEAPVSAQHDAWMGEKIATGWIWGPAKNAEVKTHPSLKPFNELSVEEQAKDILFTNIVKSFNHFAECASTTTA